MGLVMGIDPSFRGTGLAVLTPEREVIMTAFLPVKGDWPEGTSKTHADWQDCRLLQQAVLRALSVVPVRVQAAAFESPGGTKSQRAAKCGGMVIGVMAATLGCPVQVVTPQRVKKHFLGKAFGKKAAIADAVEAAIGWRSLTKTKPAREAETDAVAVLLAAWDDAVIQMARER
jgi:Holliday junction resolvasome RuvABC endonuclease subunit